MHVVADDDVRDAPCADHFLIADVMKTSHRQTPHFSNASRVLSAVHLLMRL